MHTPLEQSALTEKISSSQDIVSFESPELTFVANDLEIRTELRTMPDLQDETALNLYEDAQSLAEEIEADDEFWGVLGFSVENTEEATIVHTPSNSELNRRRTEIAEATGIHTGTFVDHPGGLIENMDFARYLARREIPMSMSADEPYFTIHDNYGHRTQWAVMCEEIFDRVVAEAQKAVDANDESAADRLVVGFLENFTALGRGPGLSVGNEGFEGQAYLAECYRGDLEMPAFVSGIRAVKDQRKQTSATRAIAKLGSEIPRAA